MQVTVKWWNDSKGYGFVTDGTKDYFCHYRSLYGEGLKTLREGQVINVEIINGPKGPEVIKCLDWNSQK